MIKEWKSAVKTKSQEQELDIQLKDTKRSRRKKEKYLCFLYYIEEKEDFFF